MIIQERENEFSTTLMGYYDDFILASVAARESQNRPENNYDWLEFSDCSGITCEIQCAD